MIRSISEPKSAELTVPLPSQDLSASGSPHVPTCSAIMPPRSLIRVKPLRMQCSGIPDPRMNMVDVMV